MLWVLGSGELGSTSDNWLSRGWLGAGHHRLVLVDGLGRGRGGLASCLVHPLRQILLILPISNA